MNINRFEYSRGNKKIGKDTVIFNMGSAQSCPARAKGLCLQCDNCYADKAEYMYPRSLPFRNRQEIYWKTTSLQEKSEDFLVCFAKHSRTVKFVRFSEAGDFWQQGDINALCALAKQSPDITFYGYTARSDLNYSMERPSNLIINGSGFMIDNEFKVVPKGTKAMCPGDCSSCSLCKEARGMVITVEEH